MNAEPFCYRILDERVGDTLFRIERVLYSADGVVEEEDGEVQLRFRTGGIVRLGRFEDGETLSIATSAWTDPFAGALSPENEEFVRTHGKWGLFDVSSDGAFATVIGKPLRAVKWVRSDRSKIVGVQLDFAATVFNVYVDADEVNVSWGEDGIPRRVREFSGS